MTKDEEILMLKSFIFDQCFDFTINMNDVFHPAADLESIDSWDFNVMYPLIAEHGLDNIITAYTAIKRGYDPDWRGKVSEGFTKAKWAIIELKDKTITFMAEETTLKENGIWDDHVVNQMRKERTKAWRQGWIGRLEGKRLIDNPNLSKQEKDEEVEVYFGRKEEPLDYGSRVLEKEREKNNAN